ncbi:MAG TPA: hypothetical protein VFP65_28165 [Anaeromyxobacteraceae bacterium]|nr:hypothetical protein [Anaeromyxobacteraceae bacterium]
MPGRERSTGLFPWIVAALVAAALAAGCTADFTPRSVLADTRVLALEAVTPAGADVPRVDAGPGEAVAFRARTWPEGEAGAGSWTFCPFTVGSQAGFACAVPQCETPAGSGAEATVVPSALALDCVAALSAGGAPLPPGVPSQLPESVTTLLRYRVTGADGLAREAVQVVLLYPGGAPVPRIAPPAFGPIRIGGVDVALGGAGPALGSGQELTVSAAVDASVTVSFFTTAGRFDFDRATGPDANVKLKHEDVGAATEATLYLVARDLRGGETVAGPFTVPIGP